MHAEVGALREDARHRARLLALGAASREAVDRVRRRRARTSTRSTRCSRPRAARTAAGTTILVKGSRFMQMERVAADLAGGGGHAG
jgi:UDP-N-acetylmuramyl pentapeptide synthase